MHVRGTLPALASHAGPTVCSRYTHTGIRPRWKQSWHVVNPVTLRFVCHTSRSCTFPGCSVVYRALICTFLILLILSDQKATAMWQMLFSKPNDKLDVCGCLTTFCNRTDIFLMTWWEYTSELAWLPVSVFDPFSLLNEQCLLIFPP